MKFQYQVNATMLSSKCKISKWPQNFESLNAILILVLFENPENTEDHSQYKGTHYKIMIEGHVKNSIQQDPISETHEQPS